MNKEQRDTAVGRIIEHIEKIRDIDLDELLKPSKGQGFTFDEVESTYHYLNGFLVELKELNFDALLREQMDGIYRALNLTHTRLSNISNFNLDETRRAVSTKESLLRELDNSVSALVLYIQPLLFVMSNEILEKRINRLLTTSSFVHDMKAKTDNIIVKLNKDAGEAVSKIRDDIEAIEASKNEVINILEAVKSASSEIGVSKYTSIFKTEADGHNSQSKIWLVLMFLFLVTTGIFGFFLWFRPTEFVEIPKTIQSIVGRMIILSSLFYLVHFSIRNYLSHRHNYTINRHRQIALDTFEIFVKSTSDEQTKNAVLLHATQAIFSSHKTGFLPKDTEIKAPNSIVDILSNFSGKGGA